MGARIHRLLLLASFGVTTLLATGLLLRDSANAPLFAASVLGLAALPPLASALARRSLPIDWLIAVAVANALLVAPELALRWADFRYESGIQFGYPRPTRMLEFEPDPDLFWRLPASDPDVNSLGFPGGEIAIPKPAGTFRMLFLGDSCAFQGYPARVEAILAHRRGGRAVEAVSFAVPGYSSHQGRVLAEKYGAALEPDLVFVHYGWNDHWLAYGAPDADKVVAAPSGLRATRAYRQLSGLRLLQLVQKVRVGFAAEPEPLAQVRVPVDRYRENLRAIRRVFSQRGVPTIYATAPSAHAERGVPAYLVQMRFAPDVRDVVREHRRYVEATREVALESPFSQLVDLVAAVEVAGNAEALFLDDGIHFTQNGLEWIAHRFAQAARPFVSSPGPRAKADGRS